MESNASNVIAEGVSMGGLVNLTLTPITGSRIRNVSKLSYRPTGHVEGSYRKFVGDQMDEYLDSLGLVRRSLPGRLEETLFRAVSESIHHSQTAEEVSTVERRIRDYLDMARKCRTIPEDSPGPNDPFELIRSAAKCYNLKIVIYLLPNQPPCVIAPAPSSRTISAELYLYDMGHKYDYIYPMTKHQSLAVAQVFFSISGILYDNLYCNVFGFKKDDINSIVKRVRRDAEASGEVKICSTTNNMGEDKEYVSSECLTTLPTGRPVIPFSAAKSIDPAIYRNVPFDLANKALKLQKKHDELPFSVKFPPESHCLARRNDKFEFAKVVEMVDCDIRLVRFLDNTQARLKTRDLRGRGMLHSGQPHYVSSNQHGAVMNHVSQIDCSIPPPPIIYNSMPPPCYISHYATAPPSPVIIPTVSAPFNLPPTYYTSQYQVTGPTSIDQYLYPEPTNDTWLDNNGRLMSSSSYSVQEWTAANPSQPNTLLVSNEEHLTPPKSTSNGSSVSYETMSHSANVEPYNVPHITQEQFNLVNKTARFSVNENGEDLPAEKNTLRYYFNLGLAYQNGFLESPADSRNICSNISGSFSEVAVTDAASNGNMVAMTYADDFSTGIQQMSSQIPFMLHQSGFYLPQFSPGAYSVIGSPGYANSCTGTVFFP